MSGLLTPTAVANEYLRSNSWRTFGSARELVDQIQRYLDRWGLTLISALDVADAVLRMIRVEDEHQTPEQAAWQSNVSEGIGDQRLDDEAAMGRMGDLALAGQVRAMSMSEFGNERERLGVTKDLAAFLGGQ